MIPVVLKFYMVGKTGDVENPLPNSEKFNCMLDQVYDQFGQRNVVVVNEKNLLEERAPFPKFYSAGWFVSETRVKENTCGSDLIVIACGDTMRSAKSKMLKNLVNMDWANEASYF